ncbi:hypothetical protein N657DRAFT_134622 [Parathielavia appendiculata]|uniref:Uncharacterized protein n=1 Tax=Parathielavia appendiculata TaxID=2587402 RepID=A0AAN6TV37_9PEZI|nr:hypothetical protein N657DRAFT_134622 [Parathielavia appendiculata]
MLGSELLDLFLRQLPLLPLTVSCDRLSHRAAWQVSSTPASLCTFGDAISLGPQIADAALPILNLAGLPKPVPYPGPSFRFSSSPLRPPQAANAQHRPHPVAAQQGNELVSVRLGLNSLSRGGPTVRKLIGAPAEQVSGFSDTHAHPPHPHTPSQTASCRVRLLGFSSSSRVASVI